MRIVSGSARGRKLRTPKDLAIRPTSDRVRESVFNMLESRGGVVGTAVLDLFAGTGALGIEALSRGAVRAVFVDSSPAAAGLLHENLAVTGFADRAAVERVDVLRFLARDAAAGFDLVFADPPYAFDAWGDVFSGVGDALVVAESDRPVAPPEGWEVLADRRYGSTVVTLARRKGGL